MGCVQFYTSEDCSTKDENTDGLETIQFLQDSGKTLKTYRFSKWGITRALKSFSHCNYQCQTQTTAGNAARARIDSLSLKLDYEDGNKSKCS